MNATIKQTLASVAPTLGPLGRWLRRVFAIDRRYGVRYAGGVERTGFYTDREARGWLDEREIRGEVFYYDPVDLRMLGADVAARSSLRP